MTSINDLKQKLKTLTSKWYYLKSETDTLLSGKSDTNHTHNTYLTTHQDITGKENISNKVTSWSSTTTDVHYPTEKLVKDTLDDIEDLIGDAIIYINQ